METVEQLKKNLEDIQIEARDKILLIEKKAHELKEKAGDIVGDVEKKISEVQTDLNQAVEQAKEKVIKVHGKSFVEKVCDKIEGVCESIKEKVK